MYTVGIITSSDKGSKGERADESGLLIKEITEKYNMKVERYIILPDDKEALEKEMKHMADDLNVNLILTTGGTGFSKRDVTPEATRNVIEREAAGVAEAARVYSLSITKRAMLSRAICGIRGETVIFNLPGSKKAVKEELEYVIDTLIHGIDILLGKDGECARV